MYFCSQSLQLYVAELKPTFHQRPNKKNEEKNNFMHIYKRNKDPAG